MRVTAKTLLLLVILLLAGGRQGNAVKIAADGQARARILVPAGATASEQFAARQADQRLRPGLEATTRKHEIATSPAGASQDQGAQPCTVSCNAE